MKGKLYLVLYYLAFLVTVAACWYSGSKITLFGGNIGTIYILLELINIVLFAVFTIRLVINKKVEKANILFPLLYIVFIFILYVIGFFFDKKLIIPMIEYIYFNIFILLDYVLLNIYSVLSIKKKKSK